MTTATKAKTTKARKKVKRARQADTDTDNALTALTEPTGTLLEQHAKARQAERAEAIKQYWALLARNAQPHQGDAEALQQCQQVLGVSDADVAAHAAMSSELRELEALAAGCSTAIAKADSARQARNAAVEKLDKVIEQAKTKHAPEIAELSAEYGEASQAEARCRQAEGRLQRLRRRVGDVLGDKQPVPTDEFAATNDTVMRE